MNTRPSADKSLAAYVLLVFVLSIPFWLIGMIPSALPANLPLSAFMFVCPMIAASILVYRSSGWDGVRQLLGRAVDYGRIRNKTWYLPALLLQPVFMLTEYGLLRLMDVPVPGLRFPVLVVAASSLVFLIAAVCEEIGWSGHATEPLQERTNALWAGIILGAVWGIWHALPYFQAPDANTPPWVAWQIASTVANRVLIVWIYNNAGRSVFAASLLHATYNISFLVLLPGDASYYDPSITFILTAITAVVVTIVWGPGTLARSPSA